MAHDVCNIVGVGVFVGTGTIPKFIVVFALSGIVTGFEVVAP